MPGVHRDKYEVKRFVSRIGCRIRKVEDSRGLRGREGKREREGEGEDLPTRNIRPPRETRNGERCRWCRSESVVADKKDRFCRSVVKDFQYLRESPN